MMDPTVELTKIDIRQMLSDYMADLHDGYVSNIDTWIETYIYKSDKTWKDQ